VIKPSLVRGLLILFVVTGAAGLVQAQAQEQSSESEQSGQTVVPVSDTVAAALLMQAGRLEDAKTVLARALAVKPEDTQAQFLLAMIAVAENDYDTAISLFRAILVREPNAERVRLELARAFFLKQDYDNAYRQFRFARAADLPPEVAANIDQYLAAIARLRRWSYNFAVALADDTNINAATDLSQVDIFGLPFVLSDDARRTSGRGIAVEGGFEWTPLLTDTIKAHFGLQGQRSEYSGGRFDDMTISGRVGPEFVFDRWQAVTLATGFQRWFGNKAYNHGFGARIALSHIAGPRLQLGVSADAQDITFEYGTEQNGVIASLTVSGLYTLNPSSSLRLVTGVAVRDAELPTFSNTTHWVAVGYYRDLPYGFSIYIEPGISRTRYYAPLFGFGETRVDEVWSVRSDLLNRRIDVRGFTPKLSFAFSDQDSTVPLYTYTRRQFSLGLTREF
jgi:thioredoxin-like negative regulator of GroEL